MSALLKIVQGPNAGAEIALPDGVEITVGKADSCDIVLADPTLPDAPLKLSADASGGVTLDGAPLEPYHVRTFGSTALAVGPDGASWSPLVFPAPAGSADEPPADAGSAGPQPPSPAPSAAPGSGTPVPKPHSQPPESAAPRRRRRILFLAAGLLLLLLLVLLLFVFACPSSPDPAAEEAAAQAAAERALPAFAERYGLALDDSGPRPVFSGNFATRADRLAATADLYSAFPGVALDLTDDESLRAAVSDSLFTLGQSALAVAAVSNRVATLAGLADSPAALTAALDALRADVPRLDGVDASAVAFRSPVALAAAPSEPAAGGSGTTPSRRRNARAASTNAPTLPVCGILSSPYPCLVLRNGSRVFPGATLGGFVVASIAPDSVVLTNATGSFTWTP